MREFIYLIPLKESRFSRLSGQLTLSRLSRASALPKLSRSSRLSRSLRLSRQLRSSVSTPSWLSRASKPSRSSRLPRPSRPFRVSRAPKLPRSSKISWTPRLSRQLRSSRQLRHQYLHYHDYRDNWLSTTLTMFCKRRNPCFTKLWRASLPWRGILWVYILCYMFSWKVRNLRLLHKTTGWRTSQYIWFLTGCISTYSACTVHIVNIGKSFATVFIIIFLLLLFFSFFFLFLLGLFHICVLKGWLAGIPYELNSRQNQSRIVRMFWLVRCIVNI